jgi:NADH-quinone oxidoreductase subunit I
MILELLKKVYRVSKALSVKSPATEDVRTHIMHQADRFRGEHQIDYETCIGCDACNKICPVSAITMKHLPFKKQNIVPEVNLGVCIFCGLCEDVCPTKPEKSIVLSGGRYDMLSGGWHEDQVNFWVHVDVPQEYIDSRLEAEEATRVKKELAKKKKDAERAMKDKEIIAPVTGAPDFSGENS